MTPNMPCDPKINVVYIGGKILLKLKKKNMYIDELLDIVAREHEVSLDHVILSLDWLYMISAIKLIEERVIISETRNS